MRLYREDGSDISWAKRNIRRLLSAVYMTPILLGLFLGVAEVGLIIWGSFAIPMIVILITTDTLYEKYLDCLCNFKGAGI